METNTIAQLIQDAKARDKHVILLGVGNLERGDDAVGPMLSESLFPYNHERFQAYSVGTAIENAMNYVRKAAGGVLIIVDAVCDEACLEGSWHFYETDRLDSLCHTTHSIPLSLLISFWRREVPDLEVHFLGVSIRDNSDTSRMSREIKETLIRLHGIFLSCIS
jgi:hydrogenase maturation protease